MIGYDVMNKMNPSDKQSVQGALASMGFGSDLAGLNKFAQWYNDYAAKEQGAPQLPKNDPTPDQFKDATNFVMHSDELTKKARGANGVSKGAELDNPDKAWVRFLLDDPKRAAGVRQAGLEILAHGTSGGRGDPGDIPTPNDPHQGPKR